MPIFIAKRINEKLNKRSKILFLGITFKEDVPDIRNSKSFELISFLRKRNHKVDLHDPFISVKEIGLTDFKKIMNFSFDGIVLAVPHKFYLQNLSKIKKFLKPNGILFDVKGKFINKKLDIKFGPYNQFINLKSHLIFF